MNFIIFHRVQTTGKPLDFFRHIYIQEIYSMETSRNGKNHKNKSAYNVK